MKESVEEKRGVQIGRGAIAAGAKGAGLAPVLASTPAWSGQRSQIWQQHRGSIFQWQGPQGAFSCATCPPVLMIHPSNGIRCRLPKPHRTRLSELVSYRYRQPQGLRNQMAKSLFAFVAHFSNPYR